MADSFRGRLYQLHAELDELSGRSAARPPSISEALATAAAAVQRSQDAVRAAAEAEPGFSRLRAAAMAAAGMGGWLLTRPRRKAEAMTETLAVRGRRRSRLIALTLRSATRTIRRKPPRVRRLWLPAIGAVALAGVAGGSAWLAVRRRHNPATF